MLRAAAAPLPMPMRSLWHRLRAMDTAELGFRLRTTLHTAGQRLAFALRPPAWRLGDLARALDRNDPALGEPIARLRQGDRAGAHAALCRHFRQRASRFALDPGGRPALITAIGRRFPDASAAARERADRILEGRYALLGYQDLRFAPGRDESPAWQIDWHYDPVHQRRMPLDFWAAVPFLESACGDHKVIWELNRHQHWLGLGRAAWLTGDERYRRAFISQLQGWLPANPPLAGSNWASMLELGLRSISWLWALHFFAADAAGDDEPWLVDLLLGLDRQLSHVARNLSFYFSPNTHLLGEALALYLAGRALPELARSRRFEALGRQVLLDESRRQVLPDGGHVERSAHYHRYTLDFYLLALRVARLTGDAAAETFAAAADRLASSARALADDRGWLPLLGDDDGGALFPIAGRAPADAADSLAAAAVLLNRPDLAVGPAPEEVYWLLDGMVPSWAATDPAPSDGGEVAAYTVAAPPSRAATVGRPHPGVALPDTGYYISRVNGGHLVMDVGPHGYLNGGHAHADALSIVLSLPSGPVLVDPGTGTYTMDPALRNRFRSSSLHNTLTLDGRSQSLPSGPFHWHTRTDARLRLWRSSPALTCVGGAHDGYAPSTVERTVLALEGEGWLVIDRVDAGGEARPRRADVHWHLAPDWRLADAAAAGDGSGRTARAGQGDRTLWLACSSPAMEIFHGDPDGLGWCSPIYGQLVPAGTVRFTEQAEPPLIVATWIAASGVTAPRLRRVALAGAAGREIGDIGLELRDGTGSAMVLASSSSAPGALGVSGVETDARLLFVRFDDGGHPRALAFVDGSYVRHPELRLELPEKAPDLYVRLDDRDRARIVSSEPQAEARLRLLRPAGEAVLEPQPQPGA